MIIMYRAIGAVVLAVWLSPVLQGVMDAWVWLMTGAQLTGTVWNAERAYLIIIWLFLLALPAVLLACWAFDTADQVGDVKTRSARDGYIGASRSTVHADQCADGPAGAARRDE